MHKIWVVYDQRVCALCVWFDESKLLGNTPQGCCTGHSCSGRGLWGQDAGWYAKPLWADLRWFVLLLRADLWVMGAVGRGGDQGMEKGVIACVYLL
jgi:hypothetical protein